MTVKTDIDRQTEPIVTIDEVNRVLEVGRLLVSVLTPKELDHLQLILNNQTIDDVFTIPLSSTSDFELGNTSIT